MQQPFDVGLGVHLNAVEPLILTQGSSDPKAKIDQKQITDIFVCHDYAPVNKSSPINFSITKNSPNFKLITSNPVLYLINICYIDAEPKYDKIKKYLNRPNKTLTLPAMINIYFIAFGDCHEKVFGCIFVKYICHVFCGI
jgi:hypothetical protein